MRRKALLATVVLLWFGVASLASSTCEFPYSPGILEAMTPYYAGMPLATDMTSQPTAVLENIGYAVGYSDIYRNPLWVCYQIFATCECEPRERDGIDFRNDMRAASTLETGFDRDNTDMDRGHHAPNNAIARCYGTQAQDETYLMTNISPQHRDLNEGIWEDLESKVLGYASQCGQVWVITGAIMDPNDMRLLQVRGSDSLKPYVPDAFYKIIVRQTSSDLGIQALGFVFPNNKPDGAPLASYLHSVRSIERMTDLDFFWQLDDTVEAALETQTASALWESQPANTNAGSCASAVSINEFEANVAGHDHGDEWIELYNPGGTAIQIGGWTLRTVDSQRTYTIPASEEVPALGFYVFDDSKLQLSNGYETIELLDAAGYLIDSTPACGLSDNLGDDSTWARLQDGGLLWALGSASRGGTNE